MKIAIAGYGVEGRANYDYWAKDPSNHLTIVDESEQPKTPLPVGVDTILGPGAFEKLDGFDLVIRTAGLAPYKIKTDGKIWSATNEFFEKCPAPIVGVTGTKGKGTMSSLIASIFQASGRTTWLVGNIGISAIDTLEKIQASDIVVFEMSSFQLWDIERSPQTAVIGLIEPDHLNVHKDMDDYVAAKGNIRQFQTANDFCVYHPTNTYSYQIATAHSEGKALRYAIPDDGGVYVHDHRFMIGEQEICSIDALQLIGQHNVENACAALTVAKLWNLDNQDIETGLQNFKGLPHRLEYLRDVNGVGYYNDSFSSAPSASIAAIKAFDQPEIVILGGIEKGSDYSELIDTIHHQTNIKEIVLIGTVRHKLAQLLGEAQVSAKVTILDAQTMPEIVSYVSQSAASGDVVLLSPGCASFDMFKDFYDRGDQFRESVAEL